MRKVFILSFFHFIIFLVSCNSTSPEQQAAESAKACYDLLVEGDVTRFMECKADIDSLSSDYAEQLLGAVRQYQHDIEKKHGGLREVRVADNPGRCDTLPTGPLVHALLILCYADSTQEEISVPMVDRDGQWLMK